MPDVLDHLDTPRASSVPADDPRWAALRAPFAAAQVSKMARSTCRACSDSRTKRCDQHTWIRCSECGQGHTSASIHLDYVGHADVTDRLLEVDPTWTWEPAYRDVPSDVLKAAIETRDIAIVMAVINNCPARQTDGGLWIRLTVLGVTRPGYGDAQGKTGPNAVKELIGDALRNAAMRFGVALYLWSKSDAATALKAPDELAEEASQEPARPPEQARGKQRNRARDQVTPEVQQQWRDWATTKARAALTCADPDEIRRWYASSPGQAKEVDVADVVTAAQRTAVNEHEPKVGVAGPLPLKWWLFGCAATVHHGGTTVQDAAAYDEPDPPADPWAAPPHP